MGTIATILMMEKRVGLGLVAGAGSRWAFLGIEGSLGGFDWEIEVLNGKFCSKLLKIQI